MPYAATLVGGGQGEGIARLPLRIGHYGITRLIGAGGMGAVYEAQQDNPRRTVALKVMRGAIASPQASRRFEYESQLLARLRHPGIAQVYEAGTHTEAATGTEFPYFAMEFIPSAKSLTEYADAVGLSLQQRIELFINICDAVQHGHQRGVIHRDLKPANILVDSSGLPKIIDFGVARASAEEDERGAGGDTQTKAGQLVGTLQYMSPEQCGGGAAAPRSGERTAPLDIDVRTDVYSLGVILYEMLTGQLPHHLEGTSLFAAVMIIRDDAPLAPSVVRRELRGDLDTIILKALDKDRSRRYGSAADLAADLGHYLRHEPILARTTGPLGKMARWVRRNRAVATVAAVSAGVLLSTSVVLIARILRESARANAALVDAEQNLKAAKDNFSLIKTFFGSMRPNDLRQGLVDVEQLLDNAARQLTEKPPALSATEADFREIIAGGYQGLGKYTKSIEHQRRVVGLKMKMVVKEDLGFADSLHQLAAAYWWNGQYDEAGPLYERSLAIRQAILGKEHADVAFSFTHLAANKLKQGSLEEATNYYQRALEMRRKLQGHQSADVAASLNNLAKCEALAGQVDRAELHFREALEMIRAIKGGVDLTTATAENNLGLFLVEAGKPADAAPMLEAALSTRLSKLNPKHHFVALSRLGLARAKFAETWGFSGDPKHRALSQPAGAAIDQALDALADLRSAIGAEHPDAVEAAGHVGLLLAAGGRSSEAIELLTTARDLTLKNPAATRRERNETQLRYAIANALRTRQVESQAPTALAELAALLEGIGPWQASESLRVFAAAVLAAPTK